MGGKIVVPPQKLAENSVLIDLEPALVKGGNLPLVIGVYVGDKKVDTIKTSFIGPRTSPKTN